MKNHYGANKKNEKYPKIKVKYNGLSYFETEPL